ncbi:MAG: LPXTG cell wall anchor domain-containing protein [Oscillospiraceae bacterium]|jgi:LPXTG-motif cell wall-anchored protein|nr:LPXTG cell wall anchor domain-containing protein [Oscillospiraceae bacterium]
MKTRILALLLVAMMIVAVAPMALAAISDPPELATAFKVGGDGSALAPWPFAAGTYDPALDGQGIPNGVYVYGLFDASYATIPDPSSVTGYTAVSSAGDVGAGTWYLLKGSSGFNYVIIGEAGAAPAAPAADAGAAAVAPPADTGSAPAVTAPPAATAPKTGDASNIAIFAGLLILAGGAAVVLAKKKTNA